MRFEEVDGERAGRSTRARRRAARRRRRRRGSKCVTAPRAGSFAAPRATSWRCSQPGHHPVRARRDRDDRGEGQGAAALRREADHQGAPRRPARAPAGRAAHQGSRRRRPALQRDRARASPRVPAATRASSRSGTARATARRWRASSCSPSDRRADSERRRGPAGPLFLRHAGGPMASPRRRRSGGLRHLVRLDAPGADPDAPRRAVHQRAHASAGSDTSGGSSGCWRGSRCGRSSGPCHTSVHTRAIGSSA